VQVTKPPAGPAWASSPLERFSATIGTSGVVFAATIGLRSIPAVASTPSVMHSRTLARHGVTQAAGLSLRWFRDTFATDSSGVSESYDQLTAEAAKIRPAPMASCGHPI